MCRVLAYLGDPLPLSELLYASDNSLVSQSYAPQMIGMLNLAGFGMVAWDPGSHAPGTPFQYHTPGLPALDANLAALARKVRGDSVLTHVRGVRLDGSAQVGPQYLHPFLYPGCSVALAHNGDLHDFADLRPWLQTEIKPAINRLLRTTLDSEWIYALLLSRLADPGAEHNGSELAQALVDTLAIIAAARKRAGQRSSSSANLFVADANNIVAARYCFDFGCAADDTRPGAAPAPYLSLWYSLGQRYGCHEGEWKLIGGRGQPRAVLLASEPLTRDTSTWLEVPEYSLVAFERRAGQARVLTRQITL